MNNTSQGPIPEDARKSGRIQGRRREFVKYPGSRGGIGMSKTLVGILGGILIITAPAWGQDAMYFYNLGLDSSLANRKIHYFSKALELNPRLAVAYEKRGVLYYFQGKYKEMLEDYLMLTELEPFNSEAQLMLGVAYLNSENYDRAVVSLTHAIELDPRLARAYSHRGEANRLKGMAAEAIQDSTRAIELGGNKQATSRAYTTRAKAYSKLGKNELAYADLNEAFRLDPSFFFYLHPSSTDSYATFVADSSLANADGIRWLGLIGILTFLFILIFKVALPLPRKKNE